MWVLRHNFRPTLAASRGLNRQSSATAQIVRVTALRDQLRVLAALTHQPDRNARDRIASPALTFVVAFHPAARTSALPDLERNDSRETEHVPNSLIGLAVRQRFLAASPSAWRPSWFGWIRTYADHFHSSNCYSCATRSRWSRRKSFSMESMRSEIQARSTW